MGEQHPVRLTSDPAMDAFPAWSPDGKQIAFVRFRNDVEANLMLIPALGGPERVLYPVRLGYNIAGTRYEISGSHRVLAWSPDGKHLAFTNETSYPGHYALFLLSLASGNVRPLFRNESDGVGDTSPAFSADGHWLAYAHLDQPHNSRIFLQRLTGEYEPRGAPQVIHEAGGFPQAPVWMPDSQSLLFLDRSRILRAEPGGTAQSIYGSSLRLDGLTITGTEPRLVSARSEEDDDLWMLHLRTGGLSTSGVPERILYSSANEVYPRFSPDGQHMVFCRTRNGILELWLADRNGENPRQLTHLSASSGGKSQLVSRREIYRSLCQASGGPGDLRDSRTRRNGAASDSR